MEFNTEFNNTPYNEELNKMFDTETDGVELETADPEFTDSDLELSALYAQPDLELEQEEQKEITIPEAMVDVISYLSSNPSVVKQLAKGIDKAKLEFIGNESGINVTDLYKQSIPFNILLNAVSRGIITSDNFPADIPNTVKIYFITPNQSDSIHHRVISGVHMFKSTPAITDLTKDQINSLGSVYKTHKGNYKSLYNFLQTECYKPLVEQNEETLPVLAFDDITLAKSAAKSSKPLQASLDKLKRAGCPEKRLTKISLLAKALRDNK